MCFNSTELWNYHIWESLAHLLSVAFQVAMTTSLGIYTDHRHIVILWRPLVTNTAQYERKSTTNHRL